MVVDKNTAISDIEVNNAEHRLKNRCDRHYIVSSSQDTLKSFIRRDDIDIILINQNVAEMVRLKSPEYSTLICL